MNPWLQQSKFPPKVTSRPFPALVDLCRFSEERMIKVHEPMTLLELYSCAKEIFSGPDFTKIVFPFDMIHPSMIKLNKSWSFAGWDSVRNIKEGGFEYEGYLYPCIKTIGTINQNTQVWYRVNGQGVWLAFSKKGHVNEIVQIEKNSYIDLKTNKSQISMRHIGLKNIISGTLYQFPLME